MKPVSFFRFVVILGIELGRLVDLRIVGILRLVGLPVLFIENGAFLHVDVPPVLAAMGKFDVIADLALEAHVGHEAEIRFRIDARHVACIGVAVGIAAGHIEQQHEIVAIGDGGHWAVSSAGVPFFVDLKNSLRW